VPKLQRETYGCLSSSYFKPYDIDFLLILQHKLKIIWLAELSYTVSISVQKTEDHYVTKWDIFSFFTKFGRMFRINIG